MGAGSIFVLLVFVVVAVIVAVVYFGFGASQWKRHTEPEDGDDRRDERPTHKVLDEEGNLVRNEYEDAPRR